MRIADRHIEWDARSVLTWQYDKAVNMIAFLSLWQKWIDVNCNQVFYGCESRLITKDNCASSGYSTFYKYYYDDDHSSISKYTDVDSLKAVLIGISQTWKTSDEKSGSTTTSVKDHVGDTFRIRHKKLYKCKLASDGSISKTWCSVGYDTSYSNNPDIVDKTDENYINSKSDACGDMSVKEYWFETEYEYEYVSWNGEQWVELPWYDTEYSGGWFDDIYAIDTCNEFGLLLWAKLIGVELPNLYGSDTVKTCAEIESQNEVWRTYLKARFYRILTNASMQDILKYLHYVFEQFDNHQVIVDDGGMYDIGSVGDDSFIEAQNSETMDDGSVLSGSVCEIVTVSPVKKNVYLNNRYYDWDLSSNPWTATYKNDEEIVKVGYKLKVKNLSDLSQTTIQTVVSIGNDCITVADSGGTLSTTVNKLKVKFLEDWQEGYTIVSVNYGSGTITVMDTAGSSKETVNSVCVYDSANDEWVEGYVVTNVTGSNIKVQNSEGDVKTVTSDKIKVHFYGDWEEGYTVYEIADDGSIIVEDEEGNLKTTVNSICAYNAETDRYEEGYTVSSVDHESYVMRDSFNVESYCERKYSQMCDYKAVKFIGVKLMTISYSCEFNQSTIEKAIMSLSDFLPHPSAVLSANSIFSGDDIPFGFNSHNFNSQCLPLTVKDASGNSYYVYPYQDADDCDIDVPKQLAVVLNGTEKVTRVSTRGYLDDKNYVKSNYSIPAWTTPFVCYAVNSDGSKGTAYWAYGTKFDSDESDVYVSQCPLYKYGSDGKVVSGSVMTPIMYDQTPVEEGVYVNGWYRKIKKIDGAWKYYDGRYDPTTTKDSDSKWITLTYNSGKYSYDYIPIGGDEETKETYEIEFEKDSSGNLVDALYVNSELRCFASYEVANNSLPRSESYDKEYGENTPLNIAVNQNIANTQSVYYTKDFFSSTPIFDANGVRCRDDLLEYNLFGRKDIDPENGGYFKGGQDGTPVGFTEIVRTFLRDDSVYTPRRFELWHKNVISRVGLMFQTAYAEKAYPNTSETDAYKKELGSYYHNSEFDEDGNYTGTTSITSTSGLVSDRCTTTEFYGVKIQYNRTNRDRRTVTDEAYIKNPNNKHEVNELFMFEDMNPDESAMYLKAPASGTYLVDFKYEKVTCKNPFTEEDEEYYRFLGIRFLKKLKSNETDDDAKLSWEERLAKYENLTKADVGYEGDTTELKPGTNAVMMPTCDYGFMKYNFVSVAESEILSTPRVLYYYGFGYWKEKNIDTYGGKAIPTSTNESDAIFDNEIETFELWGQNTLEIMGGGENGSGGGEGCLAQRNT